jgi:hypothetical protein
MNASLTVYLACLSLENAHNTVVAVFCYIKQTNQLQFLVKVFALVIQ